MTLRVDWELNPEELEFIFAVKEWVYGTPTTAYGIPDAEAIRQMIRELVSDVRSDGGVNNIVARGRFAAVRHPGMESIDIYLNVGNVSERIEDDPLGVVHFLTGLGVLDEGEDL